MKWKKWLIWGVVFLCCILMVYREWSTSDKIINFREKLKKRVEAHAQQMESKEQNIAEFYRRVDENLLEGIFYADSIVKNDKSLNRLDSSDWHEIVGEILYDHDSIDQALQRFEMSEFLLTSTPKSQADKAGCYIKKGEYGIAMKLLDKAVYTNSEYAWYKGNLYEIMNNRKKAIEVYSALYQEDTTIYKYCADRIKEIENPKSALCTELIYLNRRQRTYVTFTPINPDSSSLGITRFRFETKDYNKQKK